MQKARYVLKNRDGSLASNRVFTDAKEAGERRDAINGKRTRRKAGRFVNVRRVEPGRFIARC